MTLVLERETNPDIVGLTAVLIANPVTSKKDIVLIASGGPCGVPGETWLPVRAVGSKLAGTYRFNGETIGKEEIEAKMRAYVEENYAELLR